MTKKVLFAGGILLALALVAVAADNITGKWTYEMQGRGGGGGGGGTPRVVTLDLKVDGMNLTGTVTQPAGFGGRGGGGGGGGAAAGGAPPAPTPTAITNGKVNGDSFSFEVTREGRNGSTTTKYEGKASGGELQLKVTAPGRGGGDPTTTDIVAKKAM
jgi:hypothetical protein